MAAYFRRTIVGAWLSPGMTWIGGSMDRWIGFARSILHHSADPSILFTAPRIHPFTHAPPYRPQSRAYRKSRSMVREEILAMTGSRRLYCEAWIRRATARTNFSSKNPVAASSLSS